MTHIFSDKLFPGEGDEAHHIITVDPEAPVRAAAQARIRTGRRIFPCYRRHSNRWLVVSCAYLIDSDTGLRIGWDGPVENRHLTGWLTEADAVAFLDALKADAAS